MVKVLCFTRALWKNIILIKKNKLEKIIFNVIKEIDNKESVTF